MSDAKFLKTIGSLALGLLVLSCGCRATSPAAYADCDRMEISNAGPGAFGFICGRGLFKYSSPIFYAPVSSTAHEHAPGTVLPPNGSKPIPTSSSGSGFLISRRIIVTNNHVVANATAITCFVGDQSIDAKVVAADKDIDLSFIWLTRDPPLGTKQFSLGDSSAVKQGRRVFAMGYQLPDILGTKLSVQEGVVGAITGLAGRSSQFQIAMNVHPGRSGGPLLDERGCVVGVVMSKLGVGYLLDTGDIPQGLMFAVKADLIRMLASTTEVRDWDVHSCSVNPEMNLEQITETYSSGVVRIVGTN
jgi:S1-C subfamily serine protease